MIWPSAGSPQAAVFASPCALGPVLRVLDMFLEAANTLGHREQVAMSDSVKSCLDVGWEPRGSDRFSELADAACAAITLISYLSMKLRGITESSRSSVMEKALCICEGRLSQIVKAVKDDNESEEIDLGIERLRCTL